jgi:hypothetical protein
MRSFSVLVISTALSACFGARPASHAKDGGLDAALGTDDGGVWIAPIDASRPRDTTSRGDRPTDDPDVDAGFDAPNA